MKHFFSYFIIAIAVFSGIIISGCTDKDNTSRQLEAITLNNTSLIISIGDTYTLTATPVPADIPDVTFTWTSSNPDVASVGTDGTVTGLSAGETTITAASEGVSAECIVTVSEEEILINSLSVSPNTAEILVNGTITLTATVEPADTDITVAWSSSDESVATVDSEGNVTGLSAGNIIITASAGGLTAECKIAVVNIPVESVTLNHDEIQMTEMETFTLSAEVLPENADNKTITWSSSDERIAIVNGAGTITAIGAGEAIITAKAGNVTDECRVSVTALPIGVGYFYYSDGSWSETLDLGKGEVIGIIAYVGDMTATDPALAREHPGCTHGIVVSLDESDGIAWQSNDSLYYDRVGTWIDANLSDYETITTDVNLEDNLNIPMGYNNTKAIEAFNAAPENSQWPVNAVEYVVAYRESHPLPGHTSGWYLGSAKEMSLVASGEYNENIWDIRDAGISVKNLQTINESLAQVPGAVRIGTMGLDMDDLMMMFYWTSTEREEPEWDLAFCMVPYNGQMPNAFKYEDSIPFRVRPIFAF